MNHILVFDGDSISLGIGATHGYTLADQTMSLLPAGICYHVTALGGRQAKECLAHFATNVMPFYQRDAACNLIFFNAGDNDIALGSSAEETYIAIKAYVELAHHCGWRVIVSTKLQRYDWPEAARSIVEELNHRIVNNEAVAEGIADFQSDPIMGGDLARLNRLYYTTDQIHPANAGYAILAKIAAASLLPNVLF